MRVWCCCSGREDGLSLDLLFLRGDAFKDRQSRCFVGVLVLNFLPPMYQSDNISSSEASHPGAVGTSDWRPRLQSTHRKYDASNTPITLQLAEAECFARGHLGGVKPVILPSAA